jgi:hypothetical protein
VRNVLIGVAVVAVILIAAPVVIFMGYAALQMGWFDSFTPGHEIRGNVELHDAGTSRFHGIEIVVGPGVTCHGTGGYSDIGPGQPVTVKDENGKLLGASSLGDADLLFPAGTDGSSFCRFPFSVSGLGDAQIYTVEIGRFPRGAFSWSRADLESNGWQVGIRIRD